MSEETKSGKEVINEFFAEILNIEEADEKTVKMLVSLYRQGRLTDTNIQNALDELLNKELNDIEVEDGKN
jgi:plasmid replication initiation protein